MSTLFKQNIDTLTTNNNSYRKVIATTKTQQLVLMSLKPKENTDNEVHKGVSQFIKVEKGTGSVITKNKTFRMKAGDSIIIPSNTKHNIKAGSKGIKFYTIYSPPHHKKNTHHVNKQ